MAHRRGSRGEPRTSALPAELSSAVHLLARDAAGHPLPLPPGLQSADGDDPVGKIDLLADVHRDDRPRVARAWVAARSHPGTVVTIEVRATAAGRWHRMRYAYADLVADPSVGAVLIGVTALGEVTPDPGPQSEEPAGATTAWGLLQIGLVGDVLSAEGMVEELYGRTTTELVGMNGLDLIHPDDHKALLAAWVQVVDQHGTGRALRQRVLRGDGRVTWVMTSIGRPDPDGPVVVHDMDITQQLEGDAALRASEHRFRLLAGEVPAAVFVCDHDGALVFANEELRTLSTGSERLTNVSQLMSAESWQRWPSLIDEAHTIGFEVESETGSGAVLRVRCGPPQPDGTVVGLVEDVTVTTRWRDEARHDALTGLLSRTAIVAEIDREIARPEPDTVVAFVDLDNFKVVNDRYGHAVGDSALTSVAAALRGAVRPEDRVGRWGGDEFVLIVRQVPEPSEHLLRERLQRALAKATSPDQPAQTASIGLTRVRADDDVHRVVGRADQAMYDQKRSSNRPA